jgi:hypothetical protein
MTISTFASRRWIAVIAGVAFIVRAVYATAAHPRIFDISDAGGYHLLGRHLSHGQGYIRPYEFADRGLVRPTAEFPPGFPSVLAVLDGIGLDSYAEQRIGLAVIGAATVAAIIVLARHFVLPGAALAVGAVAAIHPALFQPEAALLGESIFLTASVLLGLAVLALRRHVDVSRALTVGLLGGVTALVRSEGLVLAVLLPVPLLVGAYRGRRRVDWRSGAALVAGISVLVGGWAARNLVTFDKPVLISNNIGSALDGANCPGTYQGPNAGFWLIGPECFEGFSDAELQVADESVVAAIHRDQGIRFIKDHKGELPRVVLLRVMRTFQLYQPEQQARLATFEGRRLLTERISGWAGWATYPLALAGLGILVGRRRYFDAWFLGVPILTVMAVSAATYGNPRFRIAAEVPMLILAAIALSAVAVRRRGRVAPTR